MDTMKRDEESWIQKLSIIQKGFTALVFGVAISVVLAACGGGGVISGPNLSGVLMDGYITGGTICLSDTTGTKCDSSITNRATTDASGAFNLSLPYGTVTAGKQLLAVIASGVAHDSDDAPGIAVSKTYTMLAPVATPSIVSPLTTMVSLNMLANPASSVAEAQAKVATDFGVSNVAITSDYISNSTNNKSHYIAKVVAAMLANTVGTQAPTITNLNSALVAAKAGVAGLPTNPSTTDLNNALLVANAALPGTSNTPFAGINFSEPTLAFAPFEGLISAAIADDPVLGASNKVAKFVKGPTGQPWAGATIYTQGDPTTSTGTAAHIYVDAFDLSKSKIVTLRSYTAASAGTKITLKLEDSNNAGANIAAEASTTKQNAWETLTFDFSNLTTGVYSSSTTYNTVSIFPAFSIPATNSVAPSSNTTFYFDDLAYTKVTSGGTGTGGGTTGATAPTAAAPTPTTAAADVLSIYSDAYTPIPGVNMNPGWGGTTAQSEVTIAGNKTQKYATLGYQGIDFTGNPIDVSVKASLHVDFWSPDLTTVKVSIISVGAENPVSLTLVAGQWNSFDIDLSKYTSPNKTAITQVKFDVLPASPGTLYMDNLYFWGTAGGGGTTGATAPTIAAPTPTTPAAGVLSIYSDAYTPIPGVNMNPGWGGTTVQSEVTIAGNKTQKYATLSYQGIDFASNPIDVSAKGSLHVDFWSPDLTTVKVSIISAGAENPVSLTLVTGQWNSFDIDLSKYTSPNKAAIIQVKFDVQPASGTLYMDNLYFWGTAAATTPVVGTFTGGIFASDYVGALPSTAKTTLGGDVGFFFDSRLANGVGAAYDYGGVSGTAQDPAGVHNFYYGLGLNLPAITNAYFGAYVKAPNNGTVNVASYTNILVNVWGPDQLFKAGTFPALEVVLNGPTVTGCASSSGGSEVTKTFNTTAQGAAQVYTLPLSGFTVKYACSGETSAAQILASVAKVSITLLNSNIQYVNKDPNGVAYTNGLNVGTIKFN